MTQHDPQDLALALRKHSMDLVRRFPLGTGVLAAAPSPRSPRATVGFLKVTQLCSYRGSRHIFTSSPPPEIAACPFFPLKSHELHVKPAHNVSSQPRSRCKAASVIRRHVSFRHIWLPHSSPILRKVWAALAAPVTAQVGTNNTHVNRAVCPDCPRGYLNKALCPQPQIVEGLFVLRLWCLHCLLPHHSTICTLLPMAVDASLCGIGRSNSPGWRTSPLVRRPHHHHTQADPRQKGPTRINTHLCVDPLL